MANSCLSGIQIGRSHTAVVSCLGFWPSGRGPQSGPEPRIVSPGPTAWSSVTLDKLLDFLEPRVIHGFPVGLLGSHESEARLHGSTQGQPDTQAIAESRVIAEGRLSGLIPQHTSPIGPGVDLEAQTSPRNVFRIF